MKWIGKIFSATGVILVGISITPAGGFGSKEDNWFRKQLRWINEFPWIKDLASTVIINPGLLYSGLLISVLGILFP